MNLTTANFSSGQEQRRPTNNRIRLPSAPSTATSKYHQTPIHPHLRRERVVELIIHLSSNCANKAHAIKTVFLPISNVYLYLFLFSFTFFSWTVFFLFFRHQQARRPVRDPPLHAQDADALLPGVRARGAGRPGLQVHRVLRLPRQGSLGGAYGRQELIHTQTNRS